MYSHPYSDLMEAFTSVLPSGTVRLNQEVTRIRWSPEPARGGVSLDLKGGERVEADYCVYTGSLGTILERGESLFEPDVAWRRRDMRMGTADNVFLLFDSEWWPEDAEGFGFLHASSPEFSYSEAEAEQDWTRWILGLYRVRFRHGVLCAWVSGAGARVMERDEDRCVSVLYCKPDLPLCQCNFFPIKCDPGEADALPAPVPGQALSGHPGAQEHNGESLCGH